MMRMFLSGSSAEHERVAAVAAALDLTGRVYLTQRWWEAGPHGTPADWSGKDSRLDRQTQQLLALDNMSAIRKSSAVWVLWPEHGYRSTCEAEMGYALAEHKNVFVTGRRASESTWSALAAYREHSDEMGLVEILRMVQS